MGSDDSTDMLMMFISKDFKTGVPAESQTDISEEGGMSDTLMKGFVANKFFEVQDVDLGFSTPQTKTQAGAPNKAIDAEAVTVTRQIDIASPALMRYCLTATTLDSAAIVKRRAAGTSSSGLGYLRLDFTGVLITGVSWSDSHVVKETITFIYRQVAISYRPQDPTGKLGATIQRNWSLFT